MSNALDKKYFVVEVTSVSPNWNKKHRIIEREMNLQFGDNAIVSGPYDAVSVIIREGFEVSGPVRGSSSEIAKATEFGSQKNRYKPKE